MKNLFKKLLSCCLVVCMVLTLCVGAITASAEEVAYDGTLEIGKAEIEIGATEAEVPFTATATGSGIAAAEVNVTLPEGCTSVSKLELDTTDENVEVTFATVNGEDGLYPLDTEVNTYGPESEDYAQYGNIVVTDNVFSYIIYTNGAASNVSIKLNITFAGTFSEAKEIPVTAKVEACKNAIDLINLQVTGDAKIIVKEAHTHAYVEVVTDPTCTEQGYTTYTCSCDDSYVDNYVDALGHNWVDGEITYDNCTDAGNMVQDCSRCDATQEVAVAPKGHTAVPNVDVPATCTTTGLQGGTHCDVCNAVIEAAQVVDALGHNFTYTDLEDGNHSVDCSRCDDADVASEAHNYVDGKCDKCEAIEVPACDHKWVMTEVVDATAEKEGWIIYECSECDVEPKRETVMYWSRHTFYKSNINMASQIEVNFKIREDRFNDSTLGTATEAFAKITVDTAFGEDTSYVTGLENYDVTINPGDSRQIRTVVVPLAAKQMMDEITANTFIKVGTQWYSGSAKTKTVVSLAKENFDKIDEKERTLYANLLVYGARAQECFGYKVDTLADSDLGGYASYVTDGELTFDGTIEQTYSTDDPEGDSSIRTYKYGLTMAAKTEARLRIRIDKYSPRPALETITARLVYGEGENVKITNIASSAFQYFEISNSDERYEFLYTDVYPKNMRDDVTLVFFVNGVATDNVVTFSIENIVAKVYSKATPAEQAMYQAMMHYADAAKALFG